MTVRVEGPTPSDVAERETRWAAARDVVTAALVDAAGDGVDVGELLASAVRGAAKLLDEDPDGSSRTGLARLVAARPGSWEAELVRHLAAGWEWES